MAVRERSGGGLRVCGAILALSMILAGGARGEEKTLRLSFTGQSMLRSDLRETSPATVSEMIALFKGADVVVTNFEAAIAKPGQRNTSAAPKPDPFAAPPGALESLRAMGVNLFALANNHAADLDVTGIRNTIEICTTLRVPCAGTGEDTKAASAPAMLDTQAGKVALIAMASGFLRPGFSAGPETPGVNEIRVSPEGALNTEDAQRILTSIREAAKGSKLVITSQHNHTYDVNFMKMFEESLPERLRPPSWHVAWAHRQIDAGADVVWAHGAPTLQGIEIYRGKLIIYDLGNFIYNLPLRLWEISEPLNFESVIVDVEFRGRQLQSVRLRPLTLNYLGQARGPEIVQDDFMRTRGLPSAAKGEEANYILNRIAQLSAPLGVKLSIKDGVGEIIIPTR